MHEKIVLPSGYETIKADFFATGREVVSNDGGHKCVIIGLVNEHPPMNWMGINISLEGVVYYSETNPEHKFYLETDKFLTHFTSWNKQYEVWLEGYRATGQDYKAQFLGFENAYSFHEAVYKLYKKINKLHGVSFSTANPSIIGWGSLYDNETDARAFNG